jgi:hypothetical protein
MVVMCGHGTGRGHAESEAPRRIRLAGHTTETATDAVGFGLLTPVLLNRKLIMPGSFVLGWALLLPAALVASVLASDVATSFNHLARLLGKDIELRLHQDPDFADYRRRAHPTP